MAKSKTDTTIGLSDRIVSLESRLELLEYVFKRELDRELYRRDEIARKRREEQQWKDALPQRMQALERFVGKCCVVSEGHHTFQGLLWRTYAEWTRDTESQRRHLSRSEVAEREEKARRRGEKYVEPERQAAVPLDFKLCIPEGEFSAALLLVPDIGEGVAPNKFNVEQATYVGIGVRSEFRRPNDCFRVKVPVEELARDGFVTV